MNIFFDVETRGLHGEAFAWGAVVTTDKGSVVIEALCSCPEGAATHDPNATIGQKQETSNWLAKNVHSHMAKPSVGSPYAIRAEFVALLRKVHKIAGEMGEAVHFVADVAWPCEARFLTQCREHIDHHEDLLPYPLLDVSTFLLAKGYDPVGTYERRENELPAHNPLNDARQTARIWFQLIRNEPVA